MKNNNLRTTNKLNTPYRTNAEYAKKRAKKENDHEYKYEFGEEDSNFANTSSRYDYEFGNEASISAKDSPLARGANIADAFSYPVAGPAETQAYNGNYGKYNEEYARDQVGNTELRKKENAREMKKRYQENLRQNYNVEFSDDELIDDCNNDCNNCPRCRH